MKYIIFLLFIMGLLMINFASAELYFNSFVQKDYSTNTTIQRNVYTVDEEDGTDPSWRKFLYDTPDNLASAPVVTTLRSGNRPVDIRIYIQNQNLPFNLTYGQIDYCNVSLILHQTEFNAQGEIVNTTTIRESYYFTAKSGRAHV